MKHSQQFVDKIAIGDKIYKIAPGEKKKKNPPPPPPPHFLKNILDLFPKVRFLARGV